MSCKLQNLIHFSLYSLLVGVFLTLSGCAYHSYQDLITDDDLNISIRGAKFTPPPRTISEIRKKFDLSYIQSFIDAEECTVLKERRRKEIRNYLSYGSATYRLATFLENEFNRGNFEEAITALETATRSVKQDNKNKAVFHSQLSRMYSRMGNKDDAYYHMGRAMLSSYKHRNGFQGNFLAGYLSLAKARISRLEGDPINEELHLKEALKNSQNMAFDRFDKTVIKSQLAEALLLQNRAEEAEAQATEIALDGSVFFDKSALPLSVLSQSLLAQGRNEEAKFSALAAYYSHKVGCTNIESPEFKKTIRILYSALANLGHYKELLEVPEKIDSDPNYILAQLLSTKNDSKDMLRTPIQKGLGSNISQANFVAYEALLVLINLGNIDLHNNFVEFDKAFDKISKLRSVELYSGLFNEFINTFGDTLLTQFHSSGKPELINKLFIVKEFGSNQKTNSALSQAAFRSGLKQPELANAVRKEQDIFNQIKSLSESLAFYTNLPPSLIDNSQVKEIKDHLNRLRNLQSSIETGISDSYAEYKALRSYRKVQISELQQALNQGEKLLVIHPHRDRYLSWMISPNKQVEFYISSKTKERLDEIATAIHSDLSAPYATYKEIPEFDIQGSLEIYDNFIAPSSVSPDDTKLIYVAKGGKFQSLPFSLLATALPTDLGYSSNEDQGLNHRALRQKSNSTRKILKHLTDYQSVPWLITKYAVADLPSASSLLTIDNFSASSNQRRKFVGIGNPLFNNMLSAQTNLVTQAENSSVIRNFFRRNLPIYGNLDTASLAELTPLPETEFELSSIAESLGADPIKDIFVGTNATEARAKQTLLEKTEVLAFATHGLIPGDIDGLNTPALALSAPSEENVAEDGLLTMDEVMELKLDTDWVVLSACNTASSDERGGEPFSGLARAFFYSGARSLLVSNWPVETKSALLLTTNMFSHWNTSNKESKAEALASSMKHLMSQESESGYSYSHPIFWAPFSVVGNAR